MNDFLKNLRTTQRTTHQRFPGGSRKEVDGNYFPGKDRRKIKDRRAPQRVKDVTISEELQEETLSQVQETLSIIASSLEKLTEQNEALVKAKIDHFQSMDLFFSSIVTMLDEKSTQFMKMRASTAPTAKEICIPTPSTDNRHTKDEVIAMIKEMRKKKATFSEIAKSLEEEGIPTFSGRGEWHAQTIHRLCKK